jgi:hypothetical protein
VRGRAPFVIGGPQLKRKEEESFVGVDLDALGSSEEKNKEVLSRRSLRSRRGTTLHRWIHSGELLLFSATLIWRGL